MRRRVLRIATGVRLGARNYQRSARGAIRFTPTCRHRACARKVLSRRNTRWYSSDMFVQTRRLHVITLLTAFALLWQALAPAGTFSLSAGRSQQWTQICTAYGIREIAVDDLNQGKGSGPSGKHVHVASCPLCLIQMLAPAVLPAAALALPVALSWIEFSHPPLRIHRAVRVAQRVSLPRGPPHS